MEGKLETIERDGWIKMSVGEKGKMKILEKQNYFKYYKIKKK